MQRTAEAIPTAVYPAATPVPSWQTMSWQELNQFVGQALEKADMYKDLGVEEILVIVGGKMERWFENHQGIEKSLHGRRRSSYRT